MKTRTKKFIDVLAVISILFGICSIAPFVLSIIGMLVGYLFSIDLQLLTDFMGWLGSTRLVVYIGWLSVPGLILGIIVSIKATSKTIRWLGILGIFLGLLGILWTYFIVGMFRLASFL